MKFLKRVDLRTFPQYILSIAFFAALVIMVLSVDVRAEGDDDEWIYYVGVANSTVNVRTGPGTEYDQLTDANKKKIQLGKQEEVTIIGESASHEGKIWYNIRFTRDGVEYEGFATSSYVSKDDSRTITPSPTPSPSPTPIPTTAPTEIPEPTKDLMSEKKDSMETTMITYVMIIGLGIIVVFIILFIKRSKYSAQCSEERKKEALLEEQRQNDKENSSINSSSYSLPEGNPQYAAKLGAAERGDVRAMIWLAEGFSYCINDADSLFDMTEVALGRDRDKEIYWYHTAIEKGSREAMIGLGESYFVSEPMYRDFVQAETWLKKITDADVDTLVQSGDHSLYIHLKAINVLLRCYSLEEAVEHDENVIKELRKRQAELCRDVLKKGYMVIDYEQVKGISEELATIAFKLADYNHRHIYPDDKSKGIISVGLWHYAELIDRGRAGFRNSEYEEIEQKIYREDIQRQIDVFRTYGENGIFLEYVLSPLE